jgi:CubicO group peptidase (beta-lactamase class C family)
MNVPSNRFAPVTIIAVALLLVFAPLLQAQDAVPLRTDQPRSATVSTGDTVLYALDSRPGFYVRGSVEQISADVVVRILRPDGTQLRRVDMRRRGLETFWFETEQEGSYQLQVVPAEEETGEFRIHLERLEPLATEPAALADQLLSAYDRDGPGAGVRVWRDGRTVYSRTFGVADMAHGVPFRNDTPTNIGSTSKQFTAFAVMLLVERGLVSLEDDVREYVPELTDFGQTVTLRHLLVHASGYREIYNLMGMGVRLSGQGDHIDRDEIIQVVQRQPALQNDPGAEWNYNNTAFGLAALVVERVSGQSFDRFMQENVFGPLGMTRSAVRPHASAIIPHRAMGYAPEREGGWREMRDLGGAVGAGAVYASLEDLQTWVENYRTPRVGTPATVEEMMTSFVTTQGDTTGYGLGLSIDEQGGLKRIHHGGADVAHRSMLVYYPEIRAGITAQGNHATFGSALAFRLAEAFFADAMREEEGEEEEPSAPEEDEEEWKPTPEELQAFTGRYFSPELEVFYTVSLEDDRLTIRHRRIEPAPMTPTEKDEFSSSGAMSVRIAFERDRNGKVIGFYLSNVRSRNVRAERLEW